MPFLRSFVRLLNLVVAIFLIAAMPVLAQTEAAKQHALSLTELPINFEPNVGQAASGTRYVARSTNMQLNLNRNSAELQLHPRDREDETLWIKFANSNPAVRLGGSDRKQSETNYLLGNDPSRWHTHVPNFGRLAYSEIYPGIGLVFYGKGQQLEYDFVVNPGADAKAIRMKLNGQKRILIQADGSLRISMADGEITFRAPDVYQVMPEGRKQRGGKFALVAKNQVGFQLGDYDKSQPLVIDPVLAYSTYLAALPATPAGVATDAQGNTYIAGYTFSAGYPATSGAYQQSCKSCTLAQSNSDIFVTKLNANGSAQIYSTFLGGSDYDQPYGIAVDANGNAVVAGRTQSTDFPTKNPEPFGMTSLADFYGFITSLSADGSTLNYSSVLGGTAVPFQAADTFVNAVTVDASGNAFIVGSTEAPGFPVTANAMHNAVPGYPNEVVFVQKFGTSGNLLTSALLGNPNASPVSDFSGAFGIAVDQGGNIYLSGRAAPGWPTTAGAYETTLTSSAVQAAAPFVSKLSPDASSFVYSTYLSQVDAALFGSAIAVDRNGDAFVSAGYASSNFPTTANAFQRTTCATFCSPSFLVELNSSGSQLLYGTLFGGAQASSASTTVSSIALDSQGNIWLAGQTNDTTFPMQHPLQSVFNPSGVNSQQGFVSEFDPTGTTLLFSTFVGGPSAGTYIPGLALDPSGKVHVAGTTGSDLYVTQGAYLSKVTPPPANVTYTYGFAEVIDPTVGAPAVCIGNPSLPGLFFGNVRVGTSSTQTVVLVNCGTQPLTFSNFQLSNSAFTVPSATNSCQQTIAVNANCTLSIVFTPASAGGFSATLTVSGNMPLPVTLSLSGTGTVPVVQIQTLWETFFPAFIGQTTQQGILINNLGSAPLAINFTQSSATAGFTIDPAACTNPIPTNKPCFIVVNFTPSVTGITTGMLYLATNDPATPVASLQLAGYGVNTYPVPEVSYISAPTVAKGSASLTLTVSGANFFPATVINVNGAPVTTRYSSFNSVTATLDSSLFANLGELQITVTNPAPGGTSAPTTLTVYQSVSFAASAMIYEPVSHLLWATIPAAASVNANSVVSVDPTTGNIVNVIAVANDPRQLAASSDGQYLYVACNGAFQIQRINLSTHAIERTFALPVDPTYGNTIVFDLHVMPGSSQTMVASLQRPGVSRGEEGLALFNDSGLVVWNSNSYNDGYVSVDNFVFAGSPTLLYALPAVTTANPFFQIFSVDNTGFHRQTVAGSPNNIQNYFGLGMATDGNLIYSTGGGVWNPATQSTLGYYAGFSTISVGYSAAGVVPDDALGRTFFLDTAYSAAQSQAVAVHAADQTTFAVDGVVPFFTATVGQVGYGENGLARWGTDGFAFLAGNGSYPQPSSTLILFHSSITRSSPGVLPPYLQYTNAAGVNAGGPAFTLQANGANFVNGSVVNWNGTALTTAFANTGLLNATVPAALIVNPGFVAITVTNPAPAGGTSSPVLFNVSPVATAAFTPPSLTFPAQLLNTASASQTVTVKNSGQAGLAISAINASGAFAQTNNCGTSLAVGASCTVNVTFKPTVLGSAQSLLIISDNARNTPGAIALSGTGTADFAIAAAPTGSTSASVSAGQTATYTLSLTGSSGYSGTVSLSCTQVPANYTCKINPATLQLQSGITTNFTVTVSPGASSTTAYRDMRPTRAMTGFLFLAALLSSFFLALSRRDKIHLGATGWSFAVSTLLLAMACLGIAACGGGSTSSGGGSPTPNAQTYTLQIVASDGTTTHSMPITLTVN